MNKGSKLKQGWKRLLKNEIGLYIYMRNINNISTVEHFLENQQMPLKVKINKKISSENRKNSSKTLYHWLMKCSLFDPENQNPGPYKLQKNWSMILIQLWEW